jgi:hypothetical protein
MLQVMPHMQLLAVRPVRQIQPRVFLQWMRESHSGVVQNNGNGAHAWRQPEWFSRRWLCTEPAGRCRGSRYGADSAGR